MPVSAKHISQLSKALHQFGVSLEQNGDHLKMRHEARVLDMQITYADPHAEEGFLSLRYDLLLSSTTKLASQIRSRLHLNKVIYARQCNIIRLSKIQAAEFLDAFHLMNSTSSAYQFGLEYKDELVAVATFSKGRKMNRLTEDQRSFELIRFCSREGVTVAGGLSKLLLHFIREKSAGDIMTYIDTSTSDGNAYLNAGFRQHSRSATKTFVVNKKTGLLRTWSGEKINSAEEYLYTNSGNLKLIFSPQV